MKYLVSLFLFISFSSFSQEEIQVIDFASGDYPLGKKVKIYFDKDWKPTIAKNSALYFREVKFKQKNIPSARVVDYHITGEKQSSFYSNYVGLDSKGKDSIVNAGPSVYYYKNGNKLASNSYFNNIGVGVVSKDGSLVNISNTRIFDYKLYAAMTYLKKDFYDVPEMSIISATAKSAGSDVAYGSQK